MLGAIGSPLCAELNRIANNGVYPDRDDFLEEQGAANVWAGTTGQGLLGALNYIVDPNRTENNFSDLTKVCNELAGTTGLSDVDALRTINHAAEVLLRGTTPQSAVFSIDADNFNTPGYVYLSGTSGNFISVPDSSLLDVTGDIDIRLKAGLTSWATGAEQRLVSKFAAGQGSYSFALLGNGTLQLTWYSDGTIAFSAASATSVPFNAGQTGWVRVALDVDNGASGNTTTFYTSTDGVNWTALGAPVVQAFIAVIHAGTANVGIGASSGGTAVLATGKFYRTQILNGINGTYALNADMTNVPFSATSFTDSTNQTITINGARLTAQDVDNLGKAGALLPITVGSSLAADSNDAKFLDHTGTNYVYTPGVSGNYLSVPDAAALDITGDIDLRWYGALDDWTPASNGRFISKYNGVDGNYSFTFGINTGGLLTLGISPNGTVASISTSTSSVAPTIVDGALLWVRGTYRTSDRRVQFFTSNDGLTWTQLGTDQTSAATSIFSSVSNLEIGTSNVGTANFLTGKIYRAQIFSDITGTNKVLDVDTSVITTGAATSFTAVTGQTVTINRSTSGRKTVAVTQPTWLFGTDDYMEVNNRYMAHSTSDENYVYLSGASGNYMSVADNPPLDVAGDIDIQVKVAMDDWTPSSDKTLIAKLADLGNSYALNVNGPSGRIALYWSTNGVSLLSAESTVAPTVTDGATLWVRATLDVDNGASGRDIKFFTSTDGTTWTQLGSTVTQAGTTSIFNSSVNLNIGCYNNGLANIVKGKFFRAIIKNGINGTTVLDANAAVITLPSQTTFVDSSSNAYTVTINKSGVGTFVSTGNYMYLPGVSANYASAPDSAALDIVGDIDIRCKVALDDWTPAATQVLLAKSTAVGSQRSYIFNVTSGGNLQLLTYTDGVVERQSVSTVATGITDGETKWVRATLDVDNGASGNTATFFTSNDGITWTQLGSPVVNAGVTSILSGTAIIEIGSRSVGTIEIARGKFFRAQVLSGIGGTVAFDANFEGSITSLTQASFTESSSNAATVTINRSGSAFRSAGVIDAGYLYPGATNTFSNSTTSFLDFEANQSWTVLAVTRTFVTNSNNRVLGTRRTGSQGTLGGAYEWAVNDTLIEGYLSDVPGTQLFGSGLNLTVSTVGNVLVSGILVNRQTNLAFVLANNNRSIGRDTLGFGAIRPANTLRIGESIGSFFNGEVYAVAVFRSVLTAKNIADIANYFNGRD